MTTPTAFPTTTDPIPLRERRVIAAVRLPDGMIATFCDDGTLIYWNEATEQWQERVPVPGTPRHYQKLGEAAGF